MVKMSAKSRFKSLAMQFAGVMPKDSEAQPETSEDLEERHKHFDH